MSQFIVGACESWVHVGVYRFRPPKIMHYSYQILIIWNNMTRFVGKPKNYTPLKFFMAMSMIAQCKLCCTQPRDPVFVTS